jgi:hypothetical protein
MNGLWADWNFAQSNSTGVRQPVGTITSDARGKCIGCREIVQHFESGLEMATNPANARRYLEFGRVIRSKEQVPRESDG